MSREIEPNAVFDPLLEYKNYYKEKHVENTLALFDELTEKSGVNSELNKATVEKLNKAIKERLEINNKINKEKTKKTFIIILLVLSSFFLLYSIVNTVQTGNFINLIVSFVSLFFIVLSILLLVKCKPKLLSLNEELIQKNKLIIDLEKEAWEQMSPLNPLLNPDLPAYLFTKTMPLIQFDKHFDSKRLDYLIRKFGLNVEENLNRSTLYVKSGEIEGNPFFICKDLVHTLGTKTYRGSITIYWTTTSVSNGRVVTHRHSQVLEATIERPCPYYNEESYLVYGNEAAANLTFSRSDSDAEILSDKQIGKLVNKQIKKLNKQAEKELRKGGNYTVLGNSEFEVLFGATNRNNELEFRLLFTPLAQKYLISLMKDKTIGFGDDFAFTKNRMVNYIYPDQLKLLKLPDSDSFFHGYEYEAVRRYFLDYNARFMRHVYFTFAPILSIPLYRMQRPHEFIYKDLYDSYVSFYDHEFIANNLGEYAFMHPESKTRNILKTQILSSGEKTDTIAVVALGYETYERIEYVQKYGRDGKYHMVPVHWTEYIPISQSSKLDIDIFDDNEEAKTSDRYQQIKKMIEEDPQRAAYRLGKYLLRLERYNKD